MDEGKAELFRAEMEALLNKYGLCLRGYDDGQLVMDTAETGEYVRVTKFYDDRGKDKRWWWLMAVPDKDGIGEGPSPPVSVAGRTY